MNEIHVHAAPVFLVSDRVGRRGVWNVLCHAPRLDLRLGLPVLRGLAGREGKAHQLGRRVPVAVVRSKGVHQTVAVVASGKGLCTSLGENDVET